MSKKPKGMHSQCIKCHKWLTLEQVDINYNKHKAAICASCLPVVEKSITNATITLTAEDYFHLQQAEKRLIETFEINGYEALEVFTIQHLIEQYERQIK